MDCNKRLLLNRYMKRYTMREWVLMIVMVFIMSIIMVSC